LDGYDDKNVIKVKKKEEKLGNYKRWSTMSEGWVGEYLKDYRIGTAVLFYQGKGRERDGPTIKPRVHYCTEETKRKGEESTIPS